MDTEEMYQRGVADAERGELHPFYYQHYYHYRRGYDSARRRLRHPRIEGFRPQRWRRLAILIAIVIIGVGAFAALRARSQTAAIPSAAQTPLATSAPAPAIVRTPLFPTITPSAEQQQGLHVGGTALVANTEGRPLRGRKEPNLKSPVQVSFKEGQNVEVREGPVQADGYTWWHIAGPGGAGWSAERSADGVIWLQPALAATP